MVHPFDAPLQARAEKVSWTPRGGGDSVDVTYNGNNYTGCEVKQARDAKPGEKYVIVLDPNRGWVALKFMLEDVSVAD